MKNVCILNNSFIEIFCHIVVLIQKLVDFSITRFTSLIREYRGYVPHSASLQTQCKVLNLDMGAYIRVGIDRLEDQNIYPNIQKLNASMRFQNSNILSKNKEYCLVTPQLFDDNGNTVYEKSKFSL